MRGIPTAGNVDGGSVFAGPYENGPGLLSFHVQRHGALSVNEGHQTLEQTEAIRCRAVCKP